MPVRSSRCGSANTRRRSCRRPTTGRCGGPSSSASGCRAGPVWRLSSLSRNLAHSADSAHPSLRHVVLLAEPAQRRPDIGFVVRQGLRRDADPGVMQLAPRTSAPRSSGRGSPRPGGPAIWRFAAPSRPSAVGSAPTARRACSMAAMRSAKDGSKKARLWRSWGSGLIGR